MPDETHRRYLLVAIDRARGFWVYYGMVEGFKARIGRLMKETRFVSAALKATLKRYLRVYNHPIPQRDLTPPSRH